MTAGVRLPAYRRYWDQLRVARYVFANERIEGGAVLDAGCGIGYGCDLLSDHADHVCGIDVSPQRVAIARSNYGSESVEFRVGDVAEAGFPAGSFDAVVSFEVIEHVEDRDAFLGALRRVLKPGGPFICSTPNKLYTIGFEEHTEEFLPEEFFEYLERHFRSVERYVQYISQSDREMDLRRAEGPAGLFLRRVRDGVAGKLFALVPNGRQLRESRYRRRHPEVFEPGTLFREVAASLDDSYRVLPFADAKSDDESRCLRFMVAVCR
jgi:ubiquinone/menaquinone biosynthesis C-methylase UbiE